jgi:folate-binding protein YgfZ
MTIEDDYRSIRDRVAIGTTADRRQLAVTGRERATYLQGLLTNDIEALTAGGGCYAAWLSPQGRMLTDMHVLESGTMILLDVPAATELATLARLEQFIFSEDVQVASLADQLATIWLHGPHAAAALEQVLDGASGLGEWRDYQHAALALRTVPVPDAIAAVVPSATPVTVARIDQLGVPGYCLYVDPSAEAALTGMLEQAGAVTVSAAAIEAARVEAAYPLFGVDMNDDIIPLEAGIETRAISFSKGCYVGQEVVIRVLHRGHGRVAKKLVSLRFDGAPPPPGSRLHAGDRDIGYVTSAAESPRFGAIGLGYVHRDFTAPGAALTEATVIPRPIA